MKPMPPAGLYVHVPFCLSVCPYCDFVVYGGRAAAGPVSRVGPFLGTLHTELDLRADALDTESRLPTVPLSSVYLGGGTPSLLRARDVAALLDHIDRRFGIGAHTEVTIEVNPGPADRGDLAGFRSAGVTRVSIGAQSLDAVELRRIGRRHDPGDVADTMAGARAAGFASVNLDLLYDIPGQTIRSWEATLRCALALAPDHVSAYALTLDDPDAEGLTGGSGDHLPLRPGARAWRARARSTQDDDRAAVMYEFAAELLVRAGLDAYELSNWARPDHESRHNMAYWRRVSMEALGPGSHAFDGRHRRWNAANLDRYMGSLAPTDGSPARLPPGGVERLDEATSRVETAMLGLRLTRGIPSALAAHAAIAPAMQWAEEKGLVERSGSTVRLTLRGQLLADEVFERLIPASAKAAAA